MKIHPDYTDIKFVITVHDHAEQENLYNELETDGISPPKTDILRSVVCVDRKPTSRSTVYNLSLNEVDQLKKDPRIKNIHPHPDEIGIKAGTCSVTQTSSEWNKSTLATSIKDSPITNMKNWALLRCTEGEQRSEWGDAGYELDTTAGTTSQTGTITLTQTGKNVDVIICDTGLPIAGHPEFAVNADGTGGTRIINYNWYQHNPEVTGGAVGTYNLGLLDPHAMHVAGSVAGNTQGWARDSLIYSLYYDTGEPGDFSYVFDYIRAFHRNKPINQTTGRKNPTIVNCSWGWSIFPGQWSFSEITAVTYRGVRYTPEGEAVTTYNGYSGVYTETELVAELVNLENGGNRITNDLGSTTATVTSISKDIKGAASLTMSTTPTDGSNDDGYWQIDLPFSIRFLNVTYNTVYVGTNGYLTFGNGATDYIVTPSVPALPKIMLCGGDLNIHTLYYGAEGLVPNETFRIRIQGGSSYTDLDDTMIYEYVFYKNSPGTIDLQVDINGAKTTTSGTFTDQQLYDWGFYPGQRIPARVPGIDVDLEDAYAEGIIIVGAAGNGRWKHDVPGGLDWDNTFEMANLYPLTEIFPLYYMRGTSPTANDTAESGGYELPAICVGSVDSASIDQKVGYSDCGPGVDIFAPGTMIISSLPYGLGDPRNNRFYLGKYSGTSMASPQVCGVIASALEIYPEMNQRAAKAYITGIAKSNQLVETHGGTTDSHDLQGAPNLFLYYKKERVDTGTVYPKIDCRARPTSGAVYPRVRIRRS